MKKHGTCVFIICLILIPCADVAPQSDTLIYYQGRITHPTMADSLLPEVTFELHSHETANQLVWGEEHNDIALKQGVFEALLGSVNPFPDTAFVIDRARWLQVIVENQELRPRQKLHSVPYALTAQSAKSLSAADGNPAQAATVDDEGNVGIGTTTPLAKLDIRGGDNSFAWSGDHSDFGYVRIGNVQICWGVQGNIAENLEWTPGGNGHWYVEIGESISFQQPF